MGSNSPFLEIPDALIESGGDGLDLCYQCGTCTALCPWSFVRPYNAREVIRSAQLGLDVADGEDLWRCVTCAMCVTNCPREVPLINVIRSMRALTASSGGYPLTIRSFRSSQQAYGNPWQGPPEERNLWAQGLNIPIFDGSQEWMLYICCTSSYDVAARGPARALGALLSKAGVSFGVAPTEAACCGDSVRETGDAVLTESLGRRNISLFQELGARKVVASSPHCFNAFNKDYPAWGGEIEAAHYSTLLDDLLAADRLRPTLPVRRKVTYHDPCYLGRHNGIYEPPRRILARLPEAQVVEMPRNRELSLCCGGGGCGMFMERPKTERFANLRLQEALDTGADTLATACAYCFAMFTDAIRVMGVEDRIEVKDLAELLAESVETNV